MNILVVGPHPDDQELGMGGTIARLAKQGHDILLLDMTNGEPTPHGDPDRAPPRASNKPPGPVSTRADLLWGQNLTVVRYSSSLFDAASSSTMRSLSLAKCCSSVVISARSLASRLSPSAAVASRVYASASARLR